MKKGTTKKEFAYKLKMKMGDDVYETSANDVTEALLAIKPPKISARALFTLESEGKKSTLLKNVFFTRRALLNKTNALYFGRNLVTLLK